MGLFEFFRKKKLAEINQNIDLFQKNPVLPEIPKQLFIEENDPLDMEPLIESTEKPMNKDKAYTIDDVYDFLQRDDFEKRGYEDALNNPDESNKNARIDEFKGDLKILIDRVTNDLKKNILNIQSHIASRERAGLMDLAEELKSRKETYQYDIDRLNEIIKSIETSSGMFERIILSYTRGFMRGITAITQSKFL